GRRLKRVWEKNLAVRSVYNTYLHAGLPPGPISQPGRASLAAALYPADVPFLYFVAQADGKHIFSATYAEHLAAIRRVKAMRRAPVPPRRACRRRCRAGRREEGGRGAAPGRAAGPPGRGGRRPRRRRAPRRPGR